MSPGDSRPSVVFVHPSDELYGSDRVLLTIVSALVGEYSVRVWLPTDIEPGERGLRAELLARGAEVEYHDLPVLRRAYRRPDRLLRLVPKMARLWRLIRNASPDVVYCTTSATLLAAPFARLARVPLVAAHIQEIWTTGDYLALAPFARACHRLIAISEASALSTRPRIRRRVRVVPNGTPAPESYLPLPAERGRLRYLVASRWNGWKGHRTLFAAWEKAAVDAELVVLGGPPPSGAAVDVPALRDGLSHPDTVTIVGEVSDPAAHIDDADVIMMPSDGPEPFGLVAIEAFARGRPVIGSAAGGLVDIIDDGVDGWLFAPRDVDGLAKILRSLDRSTVTAAGKAARDSFERHYTVQQFVTNWRAAMGLVSERG